MANMSLGGYVFPHNPSKLSDTLTPVRSCAMVETYSSVAFFSWGVRLAGRQIDMIWSAMTEEQYNELQELYASDATLTFLPDSDEASSVSVEILNLQGTYNMALTGTNVWRLDVTMTLLFLGELA